VNVENLKGAELDFWVAKARGLTPELRSLYGQSYCRINTYGSGYQIYQPTENVLLSGAIAFERHYTLFPRLDACANGAPSVWVWLAEAQQNPNYYGLFCDPSPHVAICRLCVAEWTAEEQQADAAGGRRPPAPRDFESRGLAVLTDEQAFQSLLRWKAHNSQHSS
jgi:hypothetical protein